MPTSGGYDWSDLSTPPVLETHSIIKHDIICEYLRRYISVFTQNPRNNPLRINLIDGFAGGGRYRSKHGCLIDGSPIKLIKTVCEEEARINSMREKEFKILAHYYFVESDLDAIAHLQLALKENALHTVKNVNVYAKPLLEVLNNILDDIDKRSRNHTPQNIILLDQYGYGDVPLPIIKSIFLRFRKNTEIILTFAADALINYMSQSPAYYRALERIGLENLLKHPDLQNGIEVRQMRLLIEQLLYKEIQEQCGAGFYTPFFIVSRESNRAYWLIHLSCHPKARNEMLITHWKFENGFVHHGPLGLNMMLGYDPALEAAKNQTTFDFYFDSEEEILKKLIEQIPTFISNSSQCRTVADLVFLTCNNSPATLEQYKKALFSLQNEFKTLNIYKPGSNQIRRSYNAIEFDDVIEFNKQTIFSF